MRAVKLLVSSSLMRKLATKSSIRCAPPLLNGKTPAMAAGLADHVWTIDELIGLID